MELFPGSDAQVGPCDQFLPKETWVMVVCFSSGPKLFQKLECCFHTLFPFHPQNLDNSKALDENADTDGRNLGPWITLWRRATRLSVTCLRNKPPTMLDTKRVSARSLKKFSLLQILWGYCSRSPKACNNSKQSLPTQTFRKPIAHRLSEWGVHA